MCSAQLRNFQLVCEKDHQMEAVIGYSHSSIQPKSYKYQLTQLHIFFFYLLPVSQHQISQYVGTVETATFWDGMKYNCMFGVISMNE